MTSKSPVRSAEDVDEVALSFAEVKMLATGDERIKQKMDLDIQVSKLRVLKQSYLSEHFALEDKVLKYYPKTLRECEQHIASLEQDAATAQQNPPPSDGKFGGMTLGGMVYDEKADAGTMLISLCQKNTSTESVTIGSYRGFRLETRYDSVFNHYYLILAGKTKHSVELGSDPHGNITRLDNEIARIPKKLEAARTLLADTQAQLEHAKAELEKPFAQEEELREKSEKLNELNIALNAKQGEQPVMDTEPEQDGGSASTKKSVCQAR